MRVLIGSVSHESNTFSPLHTGLADFHILRGDQVLRDLSNVPDALRGIAEILIDRGIDLVPTIVAGAMPGGVVGRSAFEGLKGALVEHNGGVDGACVFLHGAMRAQGEDYADARCVEELRAALGPAAPLVVALDMHANITTEMVHAADALIAYRTAPHVDALETGQRAAMLLLDMLEGKTRPVMGLARAPMLMPGEFAQTAAEPMRELLRELFEREGHGGILSCSLTKSHCWADVPDQGIAVVTVANGDLKRAQAVADEIAGKVWDRRRDFGSTVESCGVDEAIDIAIREDAGPVFLSDSGDNPGAGGTTDGPYVLDRLLGKGAESCLVSAMWDAEAVDVCFRAGQGRGVHLAVGGKIDTEHGRSVDLEGSVSAVIPEAADAKRLRLGGRFAVIRVHGVDLVLSEERVSIVDPEQLRALGLEPERYKINVVKRGYLEPAQRAIARRSILMLSPGCTDCDVTRLAYERVNRPVFPLDPQMEWDPRCFG